VGGSILLVAIGLQLDRGSAARGEPRSTTEARTAAGSVAARLELQAVAGCATRRALVDRVGLRSPRVRLLDRAEPGPSGPVLRVKIARDLAGAVSGELTIIPPSGRRSTRRLTAVTCDEAIDAVALMIAILLDPGAAPDARSGQEIGAGERGSLRAGPASIAPPPPSAPVQRTKVAPRPIAKPDVVTTREQQRDREPARAAPAPPASASPGTAPAPSIEAAWLASPAQRPAAGSPAPAPSPSPPTIRATPREPARARPSAPGRRRLSAGAALRGISGPAPRLMPGVAIDLSLAFERDSLWSPAVRLAAAHDALSGWSAPGGTADFALDSLQLDLCPLGLRTGRVRVRACASGMAGRLVARGSDTYGPQSHARPFIALGGTVAAALGLGSRLELQGALGVGATRTRDAFEFGSQVFYRESALTLTLGVGVGVHFP
jgi:hypothetical protein